MNDSDGSIGEFAYISIEKRLQRYGKRKFYHIIQNWNPLELNFNIDAFTHYNSSYKNIWLILCQVHDKHYLHQPFTVTLYSGLSKPADCMEYFNDFLIEINSMLENSVNIVGKNIELKIKKFICDTSARAFIKQTKGNASRDALEKCYLKGEKIDDTMVFIGINCRNRTDEEFRNFIDVDHHNAVSPLKFISPKIDIIKLFIIDSMHFFGEGVMKKFMEL